MYNTEIEKQLTIFLEQCVEGTARIDPKLIEEFGENCKKILKSTLTDNRKGEFRLRMSNLGRDIRQLHLEKLYGRQPVTPQDKLKFTYGAIIEALTMLLLKASNVPIDDANGKCSMTVSKTEIKGEYDLILNDKVYDVKSASQFSYENKFKDLHSLIEGDDFGYISQLIGYCWATGKKPGGWIVVNKVTGEIKVLEANLTNDQIKAALNDIKNTVAHFEEDRPIPECNGVVDEYFRQKPTGNRILGTMCQYCSCKYKCHPNLQALPEVMSKAQNPKIKYYVELNNVRSDSRDT